MRTVFPGSPGRLSSATSRDDATSAPVWAGESRVVPRPLRPGGASGSSPRDAAGRAGETNTPKATRTTVHSQHGT
jgi:hypothetical protein